MKTFRAITDKGQLIFRGTDYQIDNGILKYRDDKKEWNIINLGDRKLIKVVHSQS